MTSKPCPGCGQVDPYRPAASVCRACRDALDRDKALLAARKAQEGKVLTRMPHAPHALPYIQYAFEFKSAFQESFSLLAAAAGEVVPAAHAYELTDTEQAGVLVPEHNKGMNVGGYSLHPNFLLIDPGALEALRAVYASVVNIARVAHADGLADGRSLLTGLASGEITVKEFNERSIEK